MRVRIAMVQMNPVVGDVEGNGEKILTFYSQSLQYSPDIITFPELVLSGYPPEDLLLKRSFLKKNIEVLKRIAREMTDAVVVVGFPFMDKKGKVFNSAGVIENGRLKGLYFKVNLPNYGVFDEKRYFEPGREIPVFQTSDGVVFGVNICEDIWIPHSVAEIQSKKGAQILINISASPYHVEKENERKRVLRRRVKETGCHIFYNNLVGGQDELVFDGGSMVISRTGKELIRGEMFEEDIVVCDVEVKPVRRKKSVFNLISTLRTDKPSLPERERKVLHRTEEVYKALVLGLRDYVKKNGFKKVVIGLSGGIDSSLTAVIACDAIGKENVVGISMPSQYSSEETKSDARKLAENLGIKFMEIPIKSIFERYLEVLRDKFEGVPPDITEENLQARIRGNILMAFSNKFGWLVLNTGNKSEVSVGYCTLYGDMVGGFGVLKDVPKTMVYELSKYVNEKKGREVIPKSVIERPPSAELRPGQKDEDDIPPYSILDEIIELYVVKEKPPSFIARRTKLPISLVKDMINRIDRNEYKRRQAPPGIKITPKAFGKDRRMPIVNKFRE